MKLLVDTGHIDNVRSRGAPFGQPQFTPGPLGGKLPFFIVVYFTESFTELESPASHITVLQGPTARETILRTTKTVYYLEPFKGL